MTHGAAQLWQLRGSQAQLACDALQATLDLAHPEAGLVVTSYRGQKLADVGVLGIRSGRGNVRLVLRDSYVRGRDLIASYTLDPDDTTRVEVYWHVVEGESLAKDCVGIDLWVSVQTSLLDSAQEFETVSRLRAVESVDLHTSEKTQRPNACVLLRPASIDATYAQIIHPADYVAAKIERAGDQHELTASLFATRLEKGVILRARLRGLFAPRMTDRECALAAYGEFIAEPPPLTT